MNQETRDRAMTAYQEAVDKAEETLQKALLAAPERKARSRAWEAYEEAERVFQEATKPELLIYQKAVETAREAFNEAVGMKEAIEQLVRVAEEAVGNEQ